MRWLAIAVVLSALRADAKPARFDLEEPYVRSRKAKVCKPTASWAQYTRCALAGYDIKVLRTLAKAKLVTQALPKQTNREVRIALHVLRDNEWVSTDFYGYANDTSELLTFAALGEGVYRVDLGYAQSTWIHFDDVGSRPGLLRRRFTYVCEQAGDCHAAMTGCDLIVDGKGISTFRGEIKWAAGRLQIRGDTRGTSTHCAAPPPSMLVDD